MMKLLRRFSFGFLCLLAFVVLLNLISSIPIHETYTVLAPGDAAPVSPRVTVDGGQKKDEGRLKFVYVNSYPIDTVGEWVMVHFVPDAKWVPSQVENGPLTSAQMEKLSFSMRDDSESEAVIAAFRYLHKSVRIKSAGFVVAYFVPGSPAAKHLQIGDTVNAIDDIQLHALQDTRKLYKNKHAGDLVLVSGLRNGKPFATKVPLFQPKGAPNPLLGFYPMAMYSTSTAPWNVHYRLSDIGGPSAGLLLTLDIISQLSSKDITKGHEIAGTGTISAAGQVGQIGGIEEKIIAANRRDVEYFFVPKDSQSGDSNERDARAELKKLNTSMKIVPVETLSDAMNFLNALPQK